MKNVFELLKQKEQELQEIQKQVDALRIVCGLLATEEDGPRTNASVATAGVQPAVVPAPVPPQFPSLPPRVPQAAIKPPDVFGAAEGAPRQFP